jgi:hypothetical protein
MRRTHATGPGLKLAAAVLLALACSGVALFSFVLAVVPFENVEQSAVNKVFEVVQAVLAGSGAVAALGTFAGVLLDEPVLARRCCLAAVALTVAWLVLLATELPGFPG